MDAEMLNTLTVVVGGLATFVPVYIAIQVYKSFETPPAVVAVAGLPAGLALILTSFGARALLGEFSESLFAKGVVASIVGLGALVYVAKVLNGRGLMPRTTPLPVAKSD
jgi:hypothetical protein